MGHMGYSLFTLCGIQQFIISHSLGYYSLCGILVVTILTEELGVGWNMPKGFSYMSCASSGVIGTAEDFLSLSFLMWPLSSSPAYTSSHGS